jgi:hypothetical protein
MTLRLKFSPKTQLLRAARTLTNGEAILEVVWSQRPAIIAAAERGVPPVSAISEALADQFRDDMDGAPARQFVGAAVKVLLAESDFEVLQTGVRLFRDPVFRTGAVYRKAVKVQDPREAALRDVFGKMVRGLSLADQRILLDVVRTAIGET